MEKYEVLIKEAKNEFKNVDHLVYMTYPLINDPKLTVKIAEDLFKLLMKSVRAVLAYDYAYKRISSLPDKYDDSVRMFKDVIIKRYNLSRDFLGLIIELGDLINFRSNSPIEFVKDDKVVICSPNYKIKTVSYRKIKDYTNQVGLLISKIDGIISKNGF